MTKITQNLFTLSKKLYIFSMKQTEITGNNNNQEMMEFITKNKQIRTQIQEFFQVDENNLDNLLNLLINGINMVLNILITQEMYGVLNYKKMYNEFNLAEKQQILFTFAAYQSISIINLMQNKLDISKKYSNFLVLFSQDFICYKDEELKEQALINFRNDLNIILKTLGTKIVEKMIEKGNNLTSFNIPKMSFIINNEQIRTKIQENFQVNENNLDNLLNLLIEGLEIILYILKKEKIYLNYNNMFNSLNFLEQKKILTDFAIDNNLEIINLIQKTTEEEKKYLNSFLNLLNNLANNQNQIFLSINCKNFINDLNNILIILSEKIAEKFKEKNLDLKSLSL